MNKTRKNNSKWGGCVDAVKNIYEHRGLKAKHLFIFFYIIKSSAYFKLFHATEDTIKLLISAQQEVEEMYLSEPEPKMKLIDFKKDDISSKR